MVVLSDEYRHGTGAPDMWDFFVVAPDGTWGLYAALGLQPGDGRAWWWTAVARVGAPLLLVRDATLAAPKPPSFEVRGDGLWADLTCHRPMQRWQVNFEGVAIALDPVDAGPHERGDRTPIEFEFEFDAVAPPSSTSSRRYEQVCMVDGEVQIGGGGPVLALEAPVVGFRAHSW